MKRYTIIFAALFAVLLGLAGCNQESRDSTILQSTQQENQLRDGVAATGLPAIKNWRERKLMKLIYEMRDQEGLVTYTYLKNQMTGKPVFMCKSHGFAINDATGYTNPVRFARLDAPGDSATRRHDLIPQAEPNGLFTPDVSNEKWVVCLDPKTAKAYPVLVSGDIVVSPFPLD